MRFISAKYETKGTPLKNAAMFTSAQGEWSSVSKMIVARLEYEQVKLVLPALEREPNKFITLFFMKIKGDISYSSSF